MTTPTLLALADRPTVRVSPVIVSDCPDAHQVWLDRGVQHFRVGEYLETKQEADAYADMLRRALAAPQVEMVSDVPGLLEMSDLLRRVGVETKSFHDQQVAEAAYRAGYQAALNARAGGDGWIAVTDRLPPEDVPVWCFIEGGDPYIGAYLYVENEGCVWTHCENSHYMEGGKWKCYDAMWDDQYDVTHWQPLPTPPAALASQAVGVGS